MHLLVVNKKTNKQIVSTIWASGRQTVQDNLSWKEAPFN